ncbi:uncharacterized protein PV09_00617 [Verruconis gallopava]|uniref:Uncharacterized protein n=1 Tax=Verruconis gallopava TaxID=253628 RepID=A0A0D2BBG5_9PEZI|nr:uncharacterized protein PV09_00617 [Verruconis gallopava]KIW08664.1 hypothetical protein PV09_00617 [Verruconis gallopava]
MGEGENAAPNGTAVLTDEALACCCGRADCVFLAHSCKVLDAVQRDARKAGELGQALLSRHESYVADAERDRTRMLECIAHLEKEKLELETRNRDAIEENKKLLEQLEALNTAVIESDAKILSLTDALRSADQNVEHLTSLAARTARLQDQLQRFEQEQERLQEMLKVTKEDERTAILRAQKAERTINDLQDQLDRIEREAREERERHSEIIARMERRRAVELELQNAAGRLKGAAAAKTMPGGGTNTVVSSFVKDILQDNANLQMGIVELKEMLDRSNEEVERLRHLMATGDGPESPVQRSSTPNLGAELSAKELHVHHHYHAPPQKVETPKQIRREFPRRTKKKRVSLSSGSFLPPSHTPRSSVSSVHSPTASAIISHTSASLPQQARVAPKRWSIQSNQTGYSNFSSLPSSPYGDSVFDRVFSDAATDASRPTSPESEVLSPRDVSNEFKHVRQDFVQKFSLDESMRTVSDGAVPIGRQLSSSTKGKGKIESPQLDYDTWQNNSQHSVILEEDEYEDSSHTERPTTPSDKPRQQHEKTAAQEVSPPRDIPKLRRAASHESIISVHGADIHTLQSRPSQLLIGQRRMFSAGSPSTSQAVVSDTSAVALSTSRSPSSGDSRSYLSSLAASQRSRPTPPLSKKSSMGQLGQWVMGRWGYSAVPPQPPPPPPSQPIESHASAETASISSTGSSVKSKAGTASSGPKVILRAPGINQKGPIFGFGPEPQLSKQVVTTVIDEEALRESLGTG